MGLIRALAALAFVTTAAHAQDGPWALELMVTAQPTQPRETRCGTINDCFTPAKAQFGGGLRARYREPESFAVTATLATATLVDQEEKPASFTVLTLRVDAQLELGRRAERFGAALRASQVLVLGFGDRKVGALSDIPGVALVLGTTRYWGEAGLRVLSTPADPRGFHLAFGFDLGRWSGTAGLGTFGTLGFREGVVDVVNAGFGIYGDVTMRVTERFDIRLMTVISLPVQLGVGFGWRFGS